MGNTNSRIINGYQILSELGSGAFGKVYKATKDSRRWAVKEINIDSSDVDKIITKEVQIFGGLSHENVVRYYDNFRYDNAVWIVMEYCDSGTLNTFLLERPILFQGTLINFIHQIFRGVEYLHSQNVIHRDLKPNNIMVSSESQGIILKIADFGLSRVFGDSNQLTYFGYSPNFPAFYSAPELNDGVMRFESDIFSLGCLILVMFSRTTLPGTDGNPMLAPFLRHPLNSTIYPLAGALSTLKWEYIHRLVPTGREPLLPNLVFKMVQRDWRHRPNANECTALIRDVIMNM